MLVIIYPILLLSGWFTISSVSDAFKILLFFVLVGVVIWLAMFTLAKMFSW